MVPLGSDLLGRYVKQGELIGYVGDRSDATVRVVISQSDIDAVRHFTQEIQVRFSGRSWAVLSARIDREVPAANFQLPTKVLSTAGGGKVFVDPQDERGLTALEMFFQLELAFNEPLKNAYFGERVQVKFNHGSIPLAQQLYRAGRQVILRNFNV